nr:hypothetical protein [uncultured Dysosmobacter sp.]
MVFTTKSPYSVNSSALFGGVALDGGAAGIVPGEKKKIQPVFIMQLTQKPPAFSDKMTFF